jgi:hypothetical protein
MSNISLNPNRSMQDWDVCCLHYDYDNAGNKFRELMIPSILTAAQVPLSSSWASLQQATVSATVPRAEAG